MNIYISLLAVILVFGFFMPQDGPDRKYYIILMAVIHAFVCGFRYMYLTGDLMKYQWEYAHLYPYGWFSDEVLHGGRNAGFYLLMKLTAQLFGSQFQPFLVILAVFGEIAVAVVIYRYSPAPWLSYLVWNCMGFYIFGFSAIKQALAMAVLMLSFIGIAERKLPLYLFTMAIAGWIHAPSLIFLPAYFLAGRRVTIKTIAGYLLLGLFVFLFKEQLAAFFGALYFGETEPFSDSGGLGGRFFLIFLIASCGILLKGFEERQFEMLFHLMAVAGILQILSGCGNLFTRLTDYYFQFSILFIPMLFYSGRGETQPTRIYSLFPFNESSRNMLAAVAGLCLIWFYYTTQLHITIASEVDNYLNFRFLWDVK